MVERKRGVIVWRDGGEEERSDYAVERRRGVIVWRDGGEEKRSECVEG